jgi:tRNA-uridine 2-sulfurtransferase
MTHVRQTVYVGMSGGVDSSVSAALMKEAGYDVRGVFIKVWTPTFMHCSQSEDRLDAMRVCALLNIPFETLDLGEVYKRDVVDYMVREYREGRTPNPDVMCNRSVKFGSFLDYGREKGADFIATGHYARIEKRVTHAREAYKLHAGADGEKDQSYFLWTLTQAQLPYILFPVGHLQKSEVRVLAKKFKLPTAQKKDSQGLCFLGKLDVKEFLSHFVEGKPGKVLAEDGTVIGEHDGALFYVLGERHGFKTTVPGPHYVVKKDIEANTITVASRARLTDTLPRMVTLAHTNWIQEPQDGVTYQARARYREALSSVRVRLTQDGAKVHFENDATIAPAGQSLVLYDGKKCLGGGVIV